MRAVLSACFVRLHDIGAPVVVGYGKARGSRGCVIGSGPVHRRAVRRSEGEV